MARGVCFLSLVLMPLLLSHILAQNSRGSYRENVREKSCGTLQITASSQNKCLLEDNRAHWIRCSRVSFKVIAEPFHGLIRGDIIGLRPSLLDISERFLKAVWCLRRKRAAMRCASLHD